MVRSHHRATSNDTVVIGYGVVSHRGVLAIYIEADGGGWFSLPPTKGWL